MQSGMICCYTHIYLMLSLVSGAALVAARRRTKSSKLELKRDAGGK